MIESILNEKELWLPVTHRKAGLLSHFDIEMSLTEYGVVIPGNNADQYFIEGLRTGNYMPSEDAQYRVYVIDKDFNLNYYVIGQPVHYAKYKLDKVFRTTSTRFTWMERMIACNYAFRDGKVKTPKQLLLRLRKMFESHIPYEKHNLKELMQRCVEKHGELKPLPTLFEINKAISKQLKEE